MACVAARIGLGQQRIEVEVVEFFGAAAHLIEKIGAADHLLELAKAERRENFAHFLGDEAEQVDDFFRIAGELLAQAFVLRADADGAGVRMALPHHDAAHGDQRRRADAEFLGAHHRRHHHVAAGADAAIGAQKHAVAQIVERQNLIGFGEPHLPRHARIFDRSLRVRRQCRRL